MLPRSRNNLKSGSLRHQLQHQSVNHDEQTAGHHSTCQVQANMVGDMQGSKSCVPCLQIKLAYLNATDCRGSQCFIMDA